MSTELTGLREVVDGPLHEIAGRFSRFLAADWPHTALVVFTRECTGRPRKVAGATEMVNRVTLAELEQVKARVEPGRPIVTTATIAGEKRTIWVVLDPVDTLLVLIPRSAATEVPQPARLAGILGIVATSIRQQVAQASPDYLAESRAASSERARTIAEMAAAHETALVTVLTTLRSTALDDGRARRDATETASAALVALRSAPASDQAASEEQATAVFARLRREVRQMLRHHDAELEFVAPNRDDCPLPGEIAFAAHAMSRTVVLALTAQPSLDRLRIAWQSRADQLLIDVRDQGPGRLDVAALRRELDGRARTLGATVEVDTVPGWGSRAVVTLPLAAAPDRAGESENRLSRLNRRELEVLRLVAQGKRNKTIGAELGVTESTVKFHVAGVLKKLEVSSRGEAAALALNT
ncbi:LuxR C-terminal-related transcriptional regulator [Actinoplanes couchii]|uniref:Helix-turn-helix transcriptional regulator n=1 Tax=Actinoplanes couchii TaxID=403638 RepID=A0ABQ3X8A2_9ACTN|nr:LuxR C-terminal-related transcriptional regulator [Actinoplanes couchii]MDR6320263.1 DNA-binding CsgD family transcriptional regulator [Actinoplanes couchii]GID54722.1 helix-turn-helix transcriptional regulator [Actinoplanes couchii]